MTQRAPRLAGRESQRRVEGDDALLDGDHHAHATIGLVSEARR